MSTRTRNGRLGAIKRRPPGVPGATREIEIEGATAYASKTITRELVRRPARGMGRPETLAASAWLLLVVLALFVAPSAAAQIKTTETRWSFPTSRCPAA